MHIKKKILAILIAAMTAASLSACGNSGANDKPHTTYLEDEINNMSDEELGKVMENAASEMEANENDTKADKNELDVLDFWDDVKITVTGVDSPDSRGTAYSFVDIEYVGNNQIVKDRLLAR